MAAFFAHALPLRNLPPRAPVTKIDRLARQT